MSLQDSELTISGIKFKGVYLAIGFTIISTISGFIYGFAEFMGRIDTLETQLSSIEVPELAPFERRITLIEENITQSDIGTLQARLATLGTNLQTIMDQQQQLLDLKDRISENSNIVSENQRLVEDMQEDIETFEEDMRTFATEIDQVWAAYEVLESPLG